MDVVNDPYATFASPSTKYKSDNEVTWRKTKYLISGDP